MRSEQFGREFAGYIAGRDLTRKQIAERAGLDPSQVSRIVNEVQDPLAFKVLLIGVAIGPPAGARGR